MRTFVCLLTLFAVAACASASPQPDSLKTEVSGRHNDVAAARLNFGTAISLLVPIALGVALVAAVAPLFTSLFAAPIPFGATVGYARKSKSLFSGITQENVMNVLDSVTKAIEAYASLDNDAAKPKL